MTIRFRSLLPFLVAALLTTAALAVGLAGPALAHSELISSSPEDAAELDEVPTEIVLEFNEDIEPIGNEIVVLDPESTPVADGEAVIEGPTVTQALVASASGEYTVSWRVVSADGHPISGELTFTVLPPETTEATTTEAETETETEVESSAEESSAATETGEAAAEQDEGSLPGLWIAVGIAAVAAATAAVVMVMRRRRAS